MQSIVAGLKLREGGGGQVGGAVSPEGQARNGPTRRKFRIYRIMLGNQYKELVCSCNSL
jgi:hypothetical protein